MNFLIYAPSILSRRSTLSIYFTISIQENAIFLLWSQQEEKKKRATNDETEILNDKKNILLKC